MKYILIAILLTGCTTKETVYKCEIRRDINRGPDKYFVETCTSRWVNGEYMPGCFTVAQYDDAKEGIALCNKIREENK